MEEFRFAALGTQWVLQSDGKPFSSPTIQAVLKHTESFEDRFSRFRDHSEANAFRQASAGWQHLSQPMQQMLERAEYLRALTAGRYDPAIAPLLEKAGYDKHYRFTPEESVSLSIPGWRMENGRLWIDGPIGFDFGGIGKGFCIDQLAQVLRDQGHEHFLVDGGGDMYGTSRRSGEGFRVALEWPGRPDTAFGTLELRDQGLAASDTFRRRWGKWHHILDPVTQEPVVAIEGAVAVASSAWDADCTTAALFQLPASNFSAAEEAFSAPYAVFTKDQKLHISPHWPGKLFG